MPAFSLCGRIIFKLNGAKLEQRGVHLLGCFEGQLEVVALVAGIQLIEVESVRIKVMNQGTKGHSVVPAGAEVFNAHILHIRDTKDE